MTPEEEKTLEQKEINAQIFHHLNQLKDTYPIRNIGSSMDGTTNPPVEIRVTGENLATLQNIGEKLNKKLKDIDGVTTTKLQVGEQKEEYTIKPKKATLKRDQIPKSYLYNEISGLFFDQPIGEVTFDGESMPMILKNDMSIQDRQELLQQKIMTPHGEKQLSDYISLEKTVMPYQINRMDGKRYISISAEYEGQDVAGLNKEVGNLLKKLDVEEGYSASVAGDLEAQQNAAKELVVIFLISLFLVFVVMAIQLNSLKHPFIILMIIPLTITGVLIGLFLTQKELNILSAIGVIMLIGIVINNGILLIDRVRQFREQGVDAAEALVQAGKERIRPIFMTTCTTVGGMLPLAMASGTSSDYQSPLAVVLISGLLFSTMITLILIPAIYLAFEDIGRGLRKVFKKNRMKEEKGLSRQSG
jgi:HAE1 family hydrophobic/amphiphilic exporter-1